MEYIKKDALATKYYTFCSIQSNTTQRDKKGALGMEPGSAVGAKRICSSEARSAEELLSIFDSCASEALARIAFGM